MKRLLAMSMVVASFASMGALTTPAVAASCCTNSPTSTTTGAKAYYTYTFDNITIKDTKADGFSVYANYRIAGGTVNNTSQCNKGNGEFCTASIGPLSGGSTVKVRAARDVEGDTNNYGDWVTGYS